jgi:hypothetical protein
LSVACPQILRQRARGFGLIECALTARPAQDFAKEAGEEIDIV